MRIYDHPSSPYHLGGAPHRGPDACDPSRRCLGVDDAERLRFRGEDEARGVLQEAVQRRGA